MKSFIYILCMLSLSVTYSCVQNTYSRKVKFILDVSKEKNIQSVGLRGSNSPLTWEKDLEMTAMIPDSLYVVDVTFVTGYLGAEVKFVVNGTFELQDQDNRRFAFDIHNDTTVYRAIFNQTK